MCNFEFKSKLELLIFETRYISKSTNQHHEQTEHTITLNFPICKLFR